jgi:hypothetical protein
MPFGVFVNKGGTKMHRNATTAIVLHDLQCGAGFFESPIFCSEVGL